MINRWLWGVGLAELKSQISESHERACYPCAEYAEVLVQHLACTILEGFLGEFVGALVGDFECVFDG